ncbi:hypothetical protein J7K19_06325 [bacterium]|nr:hypothetical protein [bacterium]
MAKGERSFVTKVKKVTDKKNVLCPVCNSEATPVVFVKSVFAEKTNSWKFNKCTVLACKCTEKEIYGL